MVSRKLSHTMYKTLLTLGRTSKLKRHRNGSKHSLAESRLELAIIHINGTNHRGREQTVAGTGQGLQQVLAPLESFSFSMFRTPIIPSR